MIGWIALALGSLGVGLGLVALFGSTFVRAHRAEVWRREKVTKLRNRAEKGVCSDCNRTFANYAKHQADMHGVDNGWARKK